MKNNVPALGQRWISDAEPELGLGVVIEVDARAMTVLFPRSEETRVYARANAPLTRIHFGAGDRIEDADGKSWQVLSVQEQHGLFRYNVRDDAGDEKALAETRLSAELHLSRPRERLLAAQLEARHWFPLRLAAAREGQRLAQSPVRGLMGARVGLIPHQLSVAHTVASRLAPRVLLADEVGLGKTIEAGLVLHAQHRQGRAERVLVLVPDSLVHQWLVEMRRRFNLAFSLFDLERCAALAEDGDNPFLSEQLVLAPLSLLTDHPHLLTSASEAPWDILVVDEAHHLGWSPEESSIEYDVVATLAERIPGLLLLTATPEQLGLESHYARLHLLDPARYPSLEAFIEEQDGWHATRDLADALIGGEPDADSSAQLAGLLPDLALKLDQTEGREAALKALLDRHGLGRVLFRNTRAAVGGFPARESHPLRLPVPESYATWIAKGAIWPETRVDEEVWLADDPRLPWLAAWLKAHKRDKCLLITRTAPVAEALETWLRLREGVRTAVFHEGMSLLERDRAAAYFADPEGGAQILLCSEIGSEGRNFQFARHLVLFDLPDNPDQLEQRIGRLDRIGQRHTIQLHVPLLDGSAQARLFRWYDEALGVFSHCSPTAPTVHEYHLAELKPLLRPAADESALDELIGRARGLRETLEADLAAGRDRLLELQSCRRDLAEPLAQALAAQDDDTGLDEFMLAAWEAFGVHVEDHGAARTWILQPGEHQLIDAFPGLDPDGMTVCADRATALSHEDWHFLTWEHPMVRGVLEWLAQAPQGSVQVAVLRNRSVKPGTLLLEAWYEAAVQAPAALALDRVLPAEPLRLLVDARGRDLAPQVAAASLAKQLDVPEIKLARSVIKAHRDDAEALLVSAEKLAAAGVDAARTSARTAWLALEGAELDRLKALQRVNPAVRDSEIANAEARLAQGLAALDRLQMSLHTVRLIIAA
ncbi:RNA polymerase-associated protein RapA [Amnimonas aquatica]|uniref:RNA polymerase-associated protein RapA n=1 Tax=Amnimonas aquatica TaxID=2094561 RepID=A0A2P6ASK1_9GAMM|nr:RNA polymerase-associated protein RapA [Amnimonas aquatica]PQA42753.1 RNA polymerase-associated protein RapA [Amnimonas aquatica]